MHKDCVNGRSLEKNICGAKPFTSGIKFAAPFSVQEPPTRRDSLSKVQIKKTQSVPLTQNFEVDLEDF